MSDKKQKNNVIKNIKQEAKEYYTWKNMVIRYIILWFLVILLVLQFIIPNKKKTDDTLNSNTVLPIETTWFLFLGEQVDMDTASQIKFDKALSNILSNDIQYLYKLNQYNSPQLVDILSNYDVPEEFAYIALANRFNLPYRDLDEDIRDDYWLIISRDIDETKNISKSTYVFADYMDELYDEFQDRNLVLVAYYMWESDLQDYMDDQNTTSFDALYLPQDIMDKYYDIMAYSYIFQHISDYVDTSSIQTYSKTKTKTVKLSDQKNLQKWAEKNHYSYKNIRELNPRILWNSLPRWKREILVNK